MAEHDAYAALRYRDFRFLVAGRVVAFLGERMTWVAVGWELYERTGSALALGYVGLVQIIPVILLTFPAGQVADHFDRRRVVLLAQILTAVATGGLALLAVVGGPVPLFYVCLAALGVARAFNNPATRTLVPWAVPNKDLANAASWLASATQVAAVAGPALGGLLIAATGRSAEVFVLNVASALLCGALVSVVGRPKEHAVSQPPPLRAMGDGVRFIWRTKEILAAITLDLFAVLFGGATALMPIYAKDILQVGPSGLGWLNAAPSIGAIGIALVTAHLPPFRRAGLALLVAVACFGLATVGFGLSTVFPLSLLFLALVGAFDNVSVVIRNTLILTRTPDRLRGRVSAVESVFLGMSGQLGAFESGVVGAVFGPIFAVVSGGIGTIVVVALVARTWPEIVRLRSLVGQPVEQAD